MLSSRMGQLKTPKSLAPFAPCFQCAILRVAFYHFASVCGNKKGSHTFIGGIHHPLNHWALRKALPPNLYTPPVSNPQ